jgi:hypothetical protein
VSNQNKGFSLPPMALAFLPVLINALTKALTHHTPDELGTSAAAAVKQHVPPEFMQPVGEVLGAAARELGAGGFTGSDL